MGSPIFRLCVVAYITARVFLLFHGINKSSFFRILALPIIGPLKGEVPWGF